jgi:hypothetical protein
MARKNLTAPAAASSGADTGIFTDTNALTIAGAGVGLVTAGGALFVGAAVAPSQVLGGALAASTLCVGGEVKRRTGSYLPFLDKKEEAPADTAASAPAAAEPVAA